ncbi:FtsX-like permease family protein [Frondihabitans australicus]|uniref:FtsX-like permease family protein n=1 Tax=Frondihabitans australicus TaxID=386892 RepID=A0A495IDB3_9MICO|nr:FtsX-like permease family protein [Frondihabitans australicus]RKR73994.1 hypothetical protein C8E83_1095 [Frondihabitans australicus]
MSRRARSLAWRGLLWRLPLSAAVFGAAVLTFAGASLGPLYARAASESTLRDTLTQEPANATGLSLEATRRVDGLPSQELTLSQIDSSLRAAPKASSLPEFGGGIDSLVLASKAGVDGFLGVNTQEVWRAGACARMHFTAGRCPTKPGEIAVSARTVAHTSYGWKLGGTVSLASGDERVVGVYEAKDTAAPFWFGHGYFDAQVDLTGVDTVDAVFVSRSTFEALPSETVVHGYRDYPLVASRVRLAGVPGLQEHAARVQSRFADHSRFTVVTGLSRVLADAARQRHQVELGAGLVTAQLTVLGWLVLFLMMADAVEARGAELALAKLRGLSPWALWRFGLAEPLLVLIAALPVGFAVGYAGSVVFASRALLPGTPVAVPVTAPLAALAAFAGGLVAALVAARQVVRRTVIAQWRRTAESRPVPRWLLGAEIALSVVAIGLLVVLVRLPSASSLTLLAPGLLVVAVSLLGSRLIPRAARLAVAPTRATRRIGLFLAARQVSRRPAGLRLAALLAVAVGLSCFGVAGESVATANRAFRADAEIGADRVATVQIAGDVDPVDAVDRADPDGTWAMAAATWLPNGGTISGTILGVDASRIAAVGAGSRGGPTPTQLAADLRAGAAPAIRFTGTSLAVSLSASAIDPAAAPLLQVNLRSATGKEVDVESTAIANGTSTHGVAVPCSDGCVLLGLTWDRRIEVTGRMSGTITVTGLAARASATASPRTLDARLDDASAWRAATPQGQATDRLRATKLGLTDRYSSDEGGYGGVASTAVSDPAPLVAASPSIVPAAKADRVLVDDSGVSLPITLVGRSPVVPRVLDFGAVGDLTALRSGLPSFDTVATWQVWLSPRAPADALARLRKQGIEVESVQTAAARSALYGRQAPALSMLLLLVASFVGAVLAGGATAVSIASSARRRSYELAALRAIRVPTGALFRSAALEQAMLLGGAAVLGLPTGIVAALVVLPVLPEFTTSTPVVLDFVPHAAPLVVFAVGFAALVAATALVGAAVVLSHARASRLREGEE